MTESRGLGLFGLTACLLLAACSSTPSVPDMQGALDRHARATPADSADFGTPEQQRAWQPWFTVVKTLACTDVGSKAYHCDVEVDILQGGKTSRGAAAFTFVRHSDGWALIP
jgi:hypothetical protein